MARSSTAASIVGRRHPAVGSAVDLESVDDGSMFTIQRRSPRINPTVDPSLGPIIDPTLKPAIDL